MACRVPGADGVARLWDLLCAGRDAIGDIPAERFDIDQWFDPTPGRPGRLCVRSGGFLSGVDEFDAAFFGLSAHEAIRLDPQHRLIMQNVWEAIEDAGIDVRRLAGSDTGVYSSCLAADYWDVLRDAGIYDLDAAAGNGAWGMPAARIARFFDLRGPGLGVEAACSSSLLCVHLACQDLWSGRTGMAIVTSASLLLAPDVYFGLSEAEMLSPGGRCRFGDAAADGYVRSEGVLSVVLKPLAAALRDGDRVYAAITGCAVNNNGATGETMLCTSIDGQQDMLRAAYADAGVEPSEVDYVEAHGPGTPGGDLVELTALRTVLGAGRPVDRPCLVGSVKSNIGHCEGPAGLAGLVKTALAVWHRRLPATLHVRTPHPVVAEPDSPLTLVTTARPWPDTGRPALAGVSSFGLTATNVHVVLREVAPVGRPASANQPEALLLPLSARHPTALAELTAGYADQLAGADNAGDICFTAGARRTHHDHRMAVLGADADELASELRAVAGGQPSGSAVVGTKVTGRPKIVFVFPGQGAQWTGMGRELLADNPTFRARITECDAAIARETGWSLLDELARGDFAADADTGVDVVQPALFAMQVGLAATWREWGVEPDLVIGHSMGEVAAACVAGSLSVADAAAVICRRSRLVRTLREPGAMVAVQLGEAQARAAIGEFGDQVSVAVVNSATACVLAGEPDVLETVVRPLRDRGVFCRRVNVQYASHAPQVDRLLPELTAHLAEIRPAGLTVPMHSTTLDRPVEGRELDAGYWAANLRQPVRFAAAVRSALAERGSTLFVEISPHPLLTDAIADTITDAGRPGVAIGSTVRGEPELRSMLHGLATAYVSGCAPDWAAVYPGGRFVPGLPGYPWQGKRYWPAAQPGAGRSSGPAVRGSGSGDTDDRSFTMERTSTDGWLDAVRAAVGSLAGGHGPVTLTGVRDAGVASDADQLMRVELRATPDGWRFEVLAGRPGPGDLSAWRTRVTGTPRAGSAVGVPPTESMDLVRGWCTERIEDSRAKGFCELWRRPGESVGQLEPGTARAADLLVACARALGVTVPDDRPVPTGVFEAAELRLLGDPADTVWVHARLLRLGTTDGRVAGEVHLLDADHRVVAEIRESCIHGSDGAVRTARPADPPVGRTDRVVDLVAELLDVSPGEVAVDIPLPALGVDSLLATRLRGVLARESGVHLAMRDLLGGATIGDLIDRVTAAAGSHSPAGRPV